MRAIITLLAVCLLEAVNVLAGVQYGSATTAADGTFTNTFTVPFNTVPAVTTTPINAPGVITNTVSSITTTHFVGNMGSAGVVVSWVAVGNITTSGGIPIRDLPNTNASPGAALLIIDQPYPGRLTNDTFTTSVSNLFAQFGGGITINPTDGDLPYRSNATTLADSPWHRFNTNQLGFNDRTRTFLQSWNNSIGIGTEALGTGTTNIGFGNIGIGFRSLQGIRAGVGNVGYGDNTLQHVTTGQLNTALGYQSGAAIITNSYNTLIGSAWSARKGQNSTHLGAWNTINPNTFISNAIEIGYDVQATNDNEIVIGNLSNSKLITPGATGWDGSGTHFHADDGTFKSISGGGTTINPTDGRIPDRLNSTTFEDSPWFRISTNKLAFGNGTNLWLVSRPDGAGLDRAVLGIGGDVFHTLDPNTANSAPASVAFGERAFYDALKVDASVAVGWEAGRYATNITGSTLVGYATGGPLTLYNSTWVGATVGPSSGTGSTNTTFIGFGAGSQMNGATNTAVGVNAGFNAVIGVSHSVTAVGAFSGDVPGGANGGRRDFSTWLGAYAGNSAAINSDITNTVAIGFGVGVTNSNEVIIGNSANTKVFVPPIVMLGTNQLSYSGSSLTWNGVAITVP